MIGYIVTSLFGAPVQIFINTIEIPIAISIILLINILLLCFIVIRTLTRKAVIDIKKENILSNLYIKNVLLSPYSTTVKIIEVSR